MTMPMVAKRFGSGNGAYTAYSLGFHRALLGCFAFFYLSPFAAAQDKNPPPTPELLAVFAGQPIYENQLPASEQAQLQRMMQQVYGVRRRALQTVLTQKLLEADAKRRGLSIEDLIKSQVDSRVADPSDDEVDAYYRSHQSQINQPLDEARDKIRQQIKNGNIQKARATYVQGLMEQALNDGGLVVLLRPPKVAVPPDPARVRGDAQAPVTIVEFSDFSCPYCRQAEATMKELLEKYRGRIKLAYRDFPLRQIHPQAQLAAEASRCAGEQDKYWEYHDALFANPEKQGHGDLIGYARALELDEMQFAACLDSGRYKPQIERDIQMGAGSGVSATPGFFVNGTFLGGAQPLAAFEKVIEDELTVSKPAQ
jgi:protein-disulfide isomerase